MTMAHQVLVPKVGMIRTRKIGKLAYKNDTRLGSFSEAEYREVTANVSRQRRKRDHSRGHARKNCPMLALA
jgi:hypothetical protein